MIQAKPKLTGEQCNRLRQYCDQRGGMNLASKKIGVGRGTIRTAMHTGMCSEETAAKIRKFLKAQTQPA